MKSRMSMGHAILILDARLAWPTYPSKTSLDNQILLARLLSVII